MDGLKLVVDGEGPDLVDRGRRGRRPLAGLGAAGPGPGRDRPGPGRCPARAAQDGADPSAGCSRRYMQKPLLWTWLPMSFLEHDEKVFEPFDCRNEHMIGPKPLQLAQPI